VEASAGIEAGAFLSEIFYKHKSSSPLFGMR